MLSRAPTGPKHTAASSMQTTLWACLHTHTQSLSLSLSLSLSILSLNFKILGLLVTKCFEIQFKTLCDQNHDIYLLPCFAAVVAVPDSFYLVISILKCMIRYCKYVTQCQPLQPVRRSVITAMRKKTTFSCTQVCTCGSEWVSTLKNRDKLQWHRNMSIPG